MVSERRRHARISRFLEFVCFIDGRRFKTTSMDISAGGAFVDSEEEIKLGAVVLIVPSLELKKRLPIVLVGSVVRAAEDSRNRYGIKWQKCVTRDGIQNIFDFMALYMEVFPASLPLASAAVHLSPLVAYNFVSGDFEIPTFLADEEDYVPFPVELPRLRPKKIVMEKKDPVAKSRDMWAGGPVSRPSTPSAHVGEVTVDPNIQGELAGLDEGAAPTRKMVPVRLGVRYYLHDLVFSGTILALATARALLRTSLPDGLADGPFLLELPIPFKGSTAAAHLVCSVLEVRELGVGPQRELKLRIDGVQSEPAVGVFNRYVNYLLYRAMKAAREG